MRTSIIMLCIFLLSGAAFSQSTFSGDGHYYQLVPIGEGTSWQQAQNAAQTLGGYLGTITGADEDFLFTILLNDTPSDCCFLGATDEIDEGVWIWVTGETFDFTNWGAGEPVISGDYLTTSTADSGAWSAGVSTCGPSSHYLLERDSCLSGDINGDNAINVLDLISLQDYLDSSGPMPVLANSDPNGDCVVNWDDFIYLYEYLFSGGPGPVGCVCGNPEVVFTTMAICLDDGSCVDVSNPIVISYLNDGATCGELGSVCLGDINGNGVDDVCEVTGACCLPDGSCLMATPYDCESQGGMPQGDGTMCTALEACCYPDYSCANLDPLCCLAQGGSPGGAGSVCLGDANSNGLDDLCEPAEIKACCLPSGECIMDSAFICINFYGGTPQESGTSCTGIQACCLPDGYCFTVDALCCVELGGTPGGPGSWCLGDNNGNDIDDQCEDGVGACCYPDARGCQIALPEVCTGEGGTHMGAGETCSEVEACCFPDGSCISNMTPECCELMGGTPNGPGTHCQGDQNNNGIDDGCEVPEACCLPDGSCTVIIPGDCLNMGGVAQGYGTACTAPEACCMPDGSCMSLDPLCCEEQNGRPKGPGTVCLGDGNGDGIDDLCAGDVCLPGDMNGDETIDVSDVGYLKDYLDEIGPAPVANNADLTGDCIISMDDLALLVQSLFFMDPPLPEACQCDGIPVTDYSEMACCQADGGCVDSRDMDAFLNCIVSGTGTLRPLGSICLGDVNANGTDDACEDVMACCLPGGDCIVVAPAVCENQNGFPQGENTTCGPLEACCYPDGSCADIDPDCCLDIGGDPQGAGSVCLGDGDGDDLDDACDICPLDPDNDSDGDGICGDVDNCPENHNPEQGDVDHDGIGDACDDCTDTDADGYGNPGFTDNTCPVDNCPYEYNPDQIDTNGDNIGDACTFETETPSGEGVGITVGDDVGITFDAVSSSGMTEMTVTATGPAGGSSYQIVPIEEPTYYNIITTAEYNDSIEICIQYDDAGMSPEDEDALAMLHYDGLDWQDITQSRDTSANVLCGLTGSLSPFVIVLPMPRVCGDANGDDAVNVGDAVFLINYVFKAGPEPDPYDAGDANCDSAVNVGDAVYIINYAFKGGPDPCCP